MMLSSSLLISSVPVVDIDGTLFLQGGIFLLLMLVLSQLLFKPWIEVQERRAEKIGGALEAASQLRSQADAAGASYTREIVSAREAALEERSKHKNSADSQGAEILSEARSQADGRLEKDRAKIERDIEEARKELHGRIDSLAKEISVKILGRSV